VAAGEQITASRQGPSLAAQNCGELHPCEALVRSLKTHFTASLKVKVKLCGGGPHDVDAMAAWVQRLLAAQTRPQSLALTPPSKLIYTTSSISPFFQPPSPNLHTLSLQSLPRKEDPSAASILQNSQTYTTTPSTMFKTPRQLVHELVPEGITIHREGDLKIASSLQVSFQRTVRVSDNNTTNKLPPSLGNFPLFETSDYENLPAHASYVLPTIYDGPNLTCAQSARRCGSTSSPETSSPSRSMLVA
jgi:hypothetical protein